MPRVLFDHDPLPFPEKFNYNYELAAKWIGPEQIPVDSGFWALRRQIEGPATTARVHVSADQRYVLYLNGQRVGRGPERGDLRHWMFESYDLELPAGRNTLVAIVWWQSLTGKTPPPWAQMTVRPSFWLQAEGNAAAWNTGKDGWEIKSLDGIGVEVEQMVHFHHAVVGPRIRLDGTRFPWNIEQGGGEGWTPATTIQPAAAASHVGDALPHWLLRPAMLPAMRETRIAAWTVRHVDSPPNLDTVNYLVAAKNRVNASFPTPAAPRAEKIAARSRQRYIIDLETYACAFYKLVVSGGHGTYLRLRWAESLFKPSTSGEPVTSAWQTRDKENRGEIEGRHFLGTGDAFIADGGTSRVFEPLWWNAGRYIELLVETADEPLTIEGLELTSVGYPYEFQSVFDASDERLKDVEALSLHTLRMCSHETSMDCPYYEQLNYTGDTRLQSLIAMATARDDRLVRKGLKLFDWSRTGDTWSQSRYPSNTAQTIPPFSMWWVCMAYDYALWRGDLPFVRSLMPGVRSILERWREQISADGLLRQPAGWNFVDWVRNDQWRSGIPNPQFGSPCGALQWQLVYTLSKAAELEEWLNEPLLAQRNRQTASMLAAVGERAFFDRSRGMLALDLDKTRFCEHSQVFALLSDQLSSDLREQVFAAITGDAAIDRATIYFRHYVFEAFAQQGRGDLIQSQLGLWFNHRQKGMFTLLESPEPSRSDCHAWSAHPAYHFYASILGIRPAAPGFSKIHIRPQLANLEWARGEMIHPKGRIRVDFVQKNGQISGTAEVPEGIPAVLQLGNEFRPLASGVVKIAP